MREYTVSVTRDDDLWVAGVDGLPPNRIGAADDEHFADLHDDIPWLLADLIDADPGDFTVVHGYALGGRDVTAGALG